MKWLHETEHKASRKDDVSRLRWLDQHLNGVMIQKIDRALRDTSMDAKRAEGASPATINRYLEIVRAILRKAVHEWEWMDRMPKIRLLPEPKRRIRWITREEAENLLSELPTHLADMARFSLETGLRQANVSGLQWAQIDLARKIAWIHPDQAKARKAIPVPLSDVAVLVLHQQIGKHITHVFSFRGRPISQVSTKAWRAAVQRAGLEDFRWHDLRHTWASWHVQGGTPLHVLQELGGWESVEMVRRYAHFSSEHLSEFAKSMTGSIRPVATNWLRSEMKKC